ncbi:GNAT family N-acetyltransferase [Yoonia sediminilitoris]|uniref:Ribosomal-protein-alanine N-acetyltransferase n=1 Tax=Yoonia sediminilitoris TaxID=1286148 RepID=A0A2T6KRV5_9RHOB|nr:GNAT family N-acetyltransferase [Yoonia sediminilitoris]PUB19289.1 ribosomal-protein-alanine N-acetyltransferase [Yoonia sediminilitoris]RCW99457.1 ribosomal-protein-alanine N-acetyltransferase [Yoonia sediminilitoris]
MVVLTTPRLQLRGPVPRDLDAMFATYSDPGAMKYWSTEPHATADITQELLDRRIAAWQVAPLNFQITMGDQYIGNAGNFRHDEIGFMLHPDYWRQGILTEAMGAIIPYLFANTDHARLTADADPENHASCGLLRSLGFAETHRARNTFCINGVWSDSVYFALPRPATLR